MHLHAGSRSSLKAQHSWEHDTPSRKPRPPPPSSPNDPSSSSSQLDPLTTMVVASTLRGGARGSSRQLVVRDQLESLLLPASKAYLLGYIMDVLPAILKALIKFVSAELARIRKSEKRLLEERSLASETHKPRKRNQLVESIKPVLSSLHRLPLLLKAIGKALLVALGMKGMAISCFLAMAGWRISEVLVWWPLAKYYALKLTSGAGDEKAVKSALTYARVTSTFVASALSSAGAMMMLQHQSASALRKKHIQSTSGGGGKDLLQIDTTPGWIPRSLRPSNFGFLGRRMAGERQQPRFASLAPAGHFLSRLTSLTVPGTPGLVAPGGGSPGLVPGSPESRSGALPVSPTGTMLQPPEATGDAPPASPVLPSAPPQLQISEVDAKPKSTALGRPSPTIDLTLFALVRGLDTLVRALASTPTTTTALKKSTTTTVRSPTLLSRLASTITTQADGFIFVICCAQIMWAWFYHPERLPPTYVKWITNLATMDERLLLALRCIRHGKPLVWNYQSKEMTAEGVHLLGSLAEELGHPYQWGDPTRLPNTSVEAKKMIQEARRSGKEGEYVLHGAAGARGRGEMGGMPCELVHCGTGGANCYKNALYRWIRGFRMSMAIYFPVHLLPRLLFNPRGFFRQPLPALLKVLTGAARSAAFLATYIVGNWFPICLARSALLPRLFPNVPFNFWDAGIGPALGSVACGFSIFIEERRKRAEMALYVAPRALFAMVEGAKKGWLSEGERTALWAERAAFGASVGVVVCAARYRPDLLRGITGAMGWVARSKGEGRIRRSYARDA